MLKAKNENPHRRYSEAAEFTLRRGRFVHTPEAIRMARGGTRRKCPNPMSVEIPGDVDDHEPLVTPAKQACL